MKHEVKFTFFKLIGAFQAFLFIIFIDFLCNSYLCQFQSSVQHSLFNHTKFCLSNFIVLEIFNCILSLSFSFWSFINADSSNSRKRLKTQKRSWTRSFLLGQLVKTSFLLLIFFIFGPKHQGRYRVGKEERKRVSSCAQIYFIVVENPTNKVVQPQ